MLAAGALLLTAGIPGAGAAGVPTVGTPVHDVAALKAAGATPRYASYWVGEWMASSGWSGFDAAMGTAKAAGVTPVVYWYYWGDAISPACVDAGCAGKSRAEWAAMTGQLADHLRATLGGTGALVVLENEFNKHGIDESYAPTFDGHLEGVARTLKGVPGVKVVLGFGGWGEWNWAKFPRSAAQSDYVGFQTMRASTRDSEAAYRGAADAVAYYTSYVARTFGKPSFLYDLALSSWPDARWAAIQAQTLDAIFAKLVSSGSTGLQGVVYRSLHDRYMPASNYYGEAESYWGLRTESDAAKPAFDVWLKHAKGAAGVPAPTFTATFTPAKGNGWWVQTGVSASKPLAGVCAMVDGGACTPLTRQSYGWAASFRVPAGATVTFRAASTGGESVTSGGYAWPSATPVGSASFAPYGGNAWWVQAKVASVQGVTAVCASVEGGACQPLAYKPWGAWAASFHVPAGSKVAFRATLGSGGAVWSGAYAWPAA